MQRISSVHNGESGYQSCSKSTIKNNSVGPNVYFDDPDDDAASYCMPSPTSWICESLHYGLSPSHKIMLKGANTHNRTSSGLTSLESPGIQEDTRSEHSTHSNRTHSTQHSKHTDTTNRCGIPLSERFDYPPTCTQQPRHVKESLDCNMSGSVQSVSSARLVAPNVDRLSLGSVVEVLLQAGTDSVAILCSVDVLKMRSLYFQNILVSQEEERLSKHSDQVWRRSIVMQESSPYEAAAFLESLHEGKPVFSEEWNACWARLSVIWQIEEIIKEYAQQIYEHTQRLFSIAQTKHWRTNPDVFVGMRIAVFRKGRSPVPTVLTGYVVQSSSSTPYSRVRVSFEIEHFGSKHNHTLDDSAVSPSGSVRSLSPTQNITVVSSRGVFTPDRRRSIQGRSSGGTPICKQTDVLVPPDRIISSKPRVAKLQSLGKYVGRDTPSKDCFQDNASTNRSPGQYSDSDDGSVSNYKGTKECTSPLIGEISEPFWIQESDGAQWMEPDEMCAANIEKVVTSEDRRVLWEMIASLMEYSELSNPSAICTRKPFAIVLRSALDVAEAFKRKEFRSLWSVEAADVIPSQASAELLRGAYV